MTAINELTGQMHIDEASEGAAQGSSPLDWDASKASRHFRDLNLESKMRWIFGVQIGLLSTIALMFLSAQSAAGTIVMGSVDLGNFLAGIAALLIVVSVGQQVFSFVSLKSMVLKDVNRLTDAMTGLANGSKDFHIPGARRFDELGDMARALIVFRDKAFELEALQANAAETAKAKLRAEEDLRAENAARMGQFAERFESTVGDVAGGVASASSQLHATATMMAKAAESSSEEAVGVTRAMEEASAGVTAAAAASDEFAMSIGEISRQAASSAELARKASQTAHEADTTISALSESADQVGQIVELIQTIAQRTNLLALNASIEAARGGEAGRGFAVVASEVKELAAQTSKATQDVAEQIREMQDTTGASVGALRAISKQIDQLESTAVSIAAAVDQQSVAGQDLARSIDVAARGTDEVNNSISKVRETALSTGAAASQVLSSANELEEQAATLRGQVSEFINHVRSA